MAAASIAPSLHAPVQPLETGDSLGAAEFLRRYEAMPEVKKAELIEGTVYMPSPVRLAHSAPDSLIQGWLVTYAAQTPGTQAAGNSTVRLDPENVPQPDALLRILPECGGRTRLDEAGYLFGPPELIVEVAASSVAIDLHDKLRAYRRAGVREYFSLEDARSPVRLVRPRPRQLSTQRHRQPRRASQSPFSRVSTRGGCFAQQ